MFFYASKLLWLLATPSNLLVGLALAGLLLSRFGFRAGRRLAAGALVLLAAIGLGPVPDWLLGPLENRFPGAAADGRVDGVVVLGGAVLAATSLARGQLTVGDSGERVTAMADLARRHPQARILFSGGSGAILEDEPAEAEVVRRFAPTLGLDPARLLVEVRSRTTAENAADSLRLARPGPGERWLLVTSAWHMPRALGAFRFAGFPVEPYPVDYRTRPGQAWTAQPSIGLGLDRLDLALKEWVGLLVYRLVGRTGSLFPSPADPLGPTTAIR